MKLTGLRAVFVIAAVSALLAAAPSPAAIRDDPDALWRVVHGLCVTDKALTGLPAPCLAVDRARGFAVVPDPDSATQVLLVPTRRVLGIESPDLLASGSPNYWSFAWDARGYVERRARRTIPRDMIALAVNSAFGRTQRQLHIHIDCVRSSVRAALIAHRQMIASAWRPFPIALMGHSYRAMRLDGEVLGVQDPFKLLAQDDAAARADMGSRTLVVVGTLFGGTPGFVVLAGRGNTPNNPEGAGEDLLDHGCALLHAP
jgi:CDP-diacylglycerol pyrophosphatase